MFVGAAGGTLLALADRTVRIGWRLFERDLGLMMMRMAEPLARQPLGVGAGLAALALAGVAAAGPGLAAIGAVAVALPLAMIAYSAFAVARGTAADRLAAVTVEAANDGLRREIVGSLHALVSSVRADQADRGAPLPRPGRLVRARRRAERRRRRGRGRGRPRSWSAPEPRRHGEGPGSPRVNPGDPTPPVGTTGEVGPRAILRQRGPPARV